MTRDNEKPFWNWMLNLTALKWFINLPLSKKIMKYSFAQKLFNHEMITYIFYGVMTTLINLAIFRGFDMLFRSFMPKSASVLTANIIAWILALIFAFVTNKLIVFRKRGGDIKTVAREFITFTAARLFSLGCESLILWVALLTDFNEMIAKLIAMVLVVILNYIFSKLFIFKDISTKQGD